MHLRQTSGRCINSLLYRLNFGTTDVYTGVIKWKVIERTKDSVKETKKRSRKTLLEGSFYGHGFKHRVQDKYPIKFDLLILP